MASALSLKLVLEPHFHQFMLDSCMATHYSQYSITFPSGVVTALVTPLQVNGRLDGLGLDRLIEAQISAGVNGIFILGSVGEGPLLADDVANEVVRRTVARVARRVTVYAGASDNSVVRCRHRIDRLATHGVDYAVLTLPYYNWPERVGESVRFFARVAADSPLPLLAYNLPKAVGWRMPVAAIEELYEIPNLAGLKDTHGELADLEAVASSPRRPPHFSYLIGNSSLAGRLFRKGANGVVTTPANVYPAPFVALWAAYREGRFNLQSLPAAVPAFQRHHLVVPLSAGRGIRSVAGGSRPGRQDSRSAPHSRDLSPVSRPAARGMDVHAADGGTEPAVCCALSGSRAYLRQPAHAA